MAITDNRTTALKAARTASNLSGKDMAHILVVARNTYLRWENNPDMFRYGDLKKIYSSLNNEGKQIFRHGFNF
jgi:transcriptional regulator with XRE-family HTH domain